MACVILSDRARKWRARWPAWSPLADRVEFIELAEFDLAETGVETWVRLWLRGGFPRSYLAAWDSDSMAWREGFIRTFPERDIPQLGITSPATAMRRFMPRPGAAPDTGNGRRPRPG